MPGQERRHAAIVFTDIVGYTALMGSDEDKAFEVLKKNREIHSRFIEQFNGTLVKEMGDGMLISFNLASDAVYCAVEIQRLCKEQEIPLKIGIHEGEMVFEGADVLGDSVNIASRLQADAQEGCINISGSVYRDIKNKSDIQTKFVKEKSFKNVDELIKVYEVLCEEKTNQQPATKSNGIKRKNKYPYFILLGLVIVIIAILFIWQFIPSNKTVELEKSIAILPFKSLSSNPDDQYLADGVLEAILNHLQRIGDLSLRSRTSAEPYRNSPKNITEIGQELEVNYILEGSFQKVGDQANLVVQLIVAETDEHLWAKEYNKDWSEIFTVQKEVAKMVADELYAKLTEEAIEGIEAIPTTNMVAYELYLKGNEVYRSAVKYKDRNIIIESAEYYRKAIALDKKFSLAYTGLGRTYKALGEQSATKSKRTEFQQKCRKYFKEAINLDPYNGWAYASLRSVLKRWDWDTTAARTNLDISLKLEPNNLNSYSMYFEHEFTLGNCEKLKWIRKEITKINPTFNKPFSIGNLKLLQYQNNYSEMAAIADEYTNELKDVGQARLYFFGYLYSHNYDKANHIVKYMKDNSKRKSFPLRYEGLLKAREGNRALALANIDSLRLLSSVENVNNVWYAEIYAALGDKDQMYEHLEIALSEKQQTIHNIHSTPEFIPYQNEPRFQEIWSKSWIPQDRNDE